jgi:hypothetical protein
MSDSDIERHRKNLAGKDRSELIEITHKRTAWAPDHIAAKQLLDEMDRDERNKSNQPTKKEWHDKPSGKILIGIIGGVLVFLISSLIKYFTPFIK